MAFAEINGSLFDAPEGERLLIDRAQAEIERATEILRKAGKL